MKNRIRQILAWAWLLIGALLMLGLVTAQNSLEIAAICLMLGLPVWAVQLIALGIVNPLRLFRLRGRWPFA